MIKVHRRWRLPAILGSAVLLLATAGLFLLLRPAAPAATPFVTPVPSPTPSATPTSTPTGPQWSDWEDLGGSFTSAPSVASWSVKRLDVFAQSSGQTLLHLAYDGKSWYPADDLGPAIVDGPGAVARGPDRLDIFVRGTDNQLWQRPGCNGAWVGYFRWAGFSHPAQACRRGVRTASTCSSRAMTTRFTTDGGTAWPGVSTSGSAAVLRVPRQPFHGTQLDRRVLPWADNHLYQMSYDGSTWLPALTSAVDCTLTSQCPRGDCDGWTSSARATTTRCSSDRGTAGRGRLGRRSVPELMTLRPRSPGMKTGSTSSRWVRTGTCYISISRDGAIRGI